MKKYDAYKPSGVDWIGEVPNHWDIGRLKFLFSKSIAGVWGDDEKGNSDDIVCFRIADFNYDQGCLYLKENTIRNIDKKALEGRIIKRNDLLIEKSGGGDATPVGRVVLVNTDIRATCSNFIHFVSVKDNNNATFLFYYFKFLYTNKVNLLFFNQTTGIQNLKIPDYLGQTVFLPPLSEQTAIADYLDAKCAKIDNVVAVQQKRIELLKELKQSIITNAVTKGLDKNAKMKDSGVEWIGEVPEGWEVMKLKYITSYNDDVLSENTKSDKIIKYVEIADVNSREGITNFTEYEFKDAPSRARRITKKGDVIVSTVRTYLKAIAKVSADDLIVSTGFIVLRSKKINEQFLAYSALSDTFIFDVISNSVGVSYPAINSSQVVNIKIPLPPLTEQTAIAAYLDKKCAAIDRQIAKIDKQIELLKEYKQSVITECVTGKRKVC